MSLPISYFLAKPFYFKDREILPMVKNDIISCIPDEENGVTIIKMLKKSSKSDKLYELIIQIDTVDAISSRNLIKVHCECANFKFQCKSLLWKYDSLYGEPDVKQLPKKHSKPYVCKHLYAAILLLNRLNNVQSIIKLLGE